MKSILYHGLMLVLAVAVTLVWSMYMNPDCRLASPAQTVLPLLE